MTTQTGYLILAISIIVVVCILGGVIAYELIVYPAKYKNWNNRRRRYRRFLKDEKARVQILNACRMGKMKVLETIMPAAEDAVNEEIKQLLTVSQLSKNPFWLHYIKLQEQILFLKHHPAKIYREQAGLKLPFVEKPVRINVMSDDRDE